jgi:hypothetical protein
MNPKGLKPNMSLIIEHTTYPQSILPWDLRTIFDCQLSLDDVDTLQAGAVLQVGEIQMYLSKEDSCSN